MSRTPISRASSAGRRQRVLTLLPLALLSSAVTVHLAAPGPAAVSASRAPIGPSESRTPVLGTPPMTPASVSTPLADEASTTGVLPVAATADVDGIPAAALAAYQRAETVINAADASCNLSWQLLAAIGEVESHHGHFGVSRLATDGLATPSIIGVPLNGTGGTARIDDTDAGVLDGDAQFDRAVGPMQFIPSTWSVVGVDADDDGERDPQDIDDAALAAAVYLCSGDDDLSTPSGQVVAVNRYNHSAAYVERVLSLMQQYLAGGFAATPTGLPTTSSTGPTVAAGRIDELHPEAGPSSSLNPAPTPPPRGEWSITIIPPERDDTDIESPPTGPGEPQQPGEPEQPDPPSPPPVVVVAVPPAPAQDDPCGEGNATWQVPGGTKSLAWSLQGGRLVVSIKDRSTFPGGATTHDYGLPTDSGVPCPVVVPSDPSDPNWPVQPGGGAPWAPAKPEQAHTLGLLDAHARCTDEGFGPGTLGWDTCVAFYAVPGTPGAPVAGQVWVGSLAPDTRG